ncbi:unnamed protein product, partial [Ectocarpus fasciculatus]
KDEHALAGRRSTAESTRWRPALVAGRADVSGIVNEEGRFSTPRDLVRCLGRTH